LKGERISIENIREIKPNVKRNQKSRSFPQKSSKMGRFYGILTKRLGFHRNYNTGVAHEARGSGHAKYLIWHGVFSNLPPEEGL